MVRSVLSEHLCTKSRISGARNVLIGSQLTIHLQLLASPSLAGGQAPVINDACGPKKRSTC